jgi:hypothetical protein
VARKGGKVPFLREICPLKKMTPKYNAASGIIAGELLRVYSVRQSCIIPDQIFLFTAISARCFTISFFLNRCVSLMEIQFTYSKFHQIINGTTHQISSVGGSSIS